MDMTERRFNPREGRAVRLILIGAPGSGKGTQAELLKEHLKLHHLSTGEMLRSAVAQGTELGRRVETIMKLGELVSDAIVIELIHERLEDEAVAESFMLDGFPRTLAQAKALDEMLHSKGLALDRVLLFEIPDETIVERITGRRTDPVTGKIYHVKFNPPPPDVARRVVQRPDDRESVVRLRNEKFHSETEPVIPYYESRGIVSRLDATQRPSEVFQEILKILSEIP
jgi:adenylate kinase